MSSRLIALLRLQIFFFGCVEFGGSGWNETFKADELAGDAAAAAPTLIVEAEETVLEAATGVRDELSEAP